MTEKLVSELRERLEYDHVDGTLYWKRRAVTKYRDKIWNARYAGTIAGTQGTSGYLQINFTFEGERRCVPVHRAIWAIVHGFMPSCLVDHVDGNRSNNLLSNLRLATHSQNSMNQKVSKESTTGLKGVGVQGERYSAKIKVRGRLIWLGSFDTKAEAAAAYAEAATFHFGQFARVATADLVQGGQR